ncbi:hypothetical protein [Streptomyces sp. NBC_00401]|uniref:hypothetical protein n=1 Tax=Streptomyces sp. NBC_00401 TaxID=2975738 RepID=UPI00225272E0|nr:hypothetical protein [Streptomyces sp. NBC_00401]MCX5085670.1 hypothetical protein [Streptomyces sp. NBC_00401]
MRATPTTRLEADTWIAVLIRHEHLHSAEPGPDETWTVKRTAASRPQTLHHPVLALDFVSAVLRDVHGDASGLRR